MAPVTFFALNSIDCKTSLILLPLVASTGLVVPKILWPKQTEGRLLESSLRTIPGITLGMSPDEMKSALNTSGGFFAYAPESLKIAHDRLVPSEDSEWQLFSRISLLTQEGLGVKNAVYDIKISDSLPGDDPKKVRESVLAFKGRAEAMGINASYFLSPAHQPLGQALGPVHELIEALEILKGRGPLDIKKIVLEQGADLLLLAAHAANRTEAKSTLKTLILRGDALNKIEDIIRAQRGYPEIVNDYSRLPAVDYQISILARRSGFVTRMRMDGMKRLKAKLTHIHPGAGLHIQKNIGDSVHEDEVLARLHYPESHCPPKLQSEIRSLYDIADRKPDFSPLISEKIKGNF
jgi:pyrimidine-nucleoside phosphorylase